MKAFSKEGKTHNYVNEVRVKALSSCLEGRGSGRIVGLALYCSSNDTNLVGEF